MQRSNPNYPSYLSIEEKDKRIEYEFLIESWKSECSMVGAFINQAKELVEDVWTCCSDLLKEWDISEIEEYLNSVGSMSTNLEAIK